MRLLLQAQRLCSLSSEMSSACELAQSNIPSHKSPVQRGKLQVTTPQLAENVLKEMKTAVGVHIGLNFFSWAKLDRSGTVLAWDMMDFTSSGIKKLHPTKLFEQAMEMKLKLPAGDVFVLEDNQSGSHQTQQQQASLFLGAHQLSAMLLVLLNLDSNKTGVLESLFEHRVYFLRSRLSARLFRTIVGSERVSAQSVVQNILSSQTFSPHYSAISVSPSLQEGYLCSTSVQRENLCRALLLVMTFMELAVTKNPQAISFVSSRLK